MSSARSSIRQEPHRVYWQQWAAAAPSLSNKADSTSTIPHKQQQQHQVVTKSAAVRISDEACAQDVTRLLQTSIATLEQQNDDSVVKEEEDALVLVATCYHTNSVEFKHDNNKSNDNAVACEPLHIIKTLKKDDKPLQVRDNLLQRIRQQQQQQQGTNVIAPKLQWFFVSSSSSREMPNYIQLDGYCTSNNDSDESDDDDSSDSDCENNDDDKSEINHDDDTDSSYWWRTKQPGFVHVVPSDEKDIRQQQQKAPISSESKLCSKRLQKYQRRHVQLKLAQQSSSSSLMMDPANIVISGFLLQQSHRDAHVWKRINCVLTEEHVWTVSRLYTMDDGMKMARHVKIPLHGSSVLVTPPNKKTTTTATTTLSTVPYVFQVVTKSGSSYNFRAGSKREQEDWIKAITNRIEIFQENEFLQHASLICENTTLARNQRMHAIAVQPLLPTTTTTSTTTTISIDEEYKMVVLRWGMEVAEFRELCRHVASRMPDHYQRPIVVAVSNNDELNGNPTPKRLFSSPQQHENDCSSILDKDTKDMIGSAWDLAAILLARAVQYMHPTIPTTTRSSLESACRHVDYIITGQFRDMDDIVASSINSVKTRRSRIHNNNKNKNMTMDAPPIDLFDTLLAQLQFRCKSGDEQDVREAAIETPLSK